MRPSCRARNVMAEDVDADEELLGRPPGRFGLAIDVDRQWGERNDQVGRGAGGGERQDQAKREERDEHGNAAAILVIGDAEIAAQEAFLEPGLQEEPQCHQRGAGEPEPGRLERSRREGREQETGVDRVTHDRVRPGVDDPVTFLLGDRA